MNRRILITMLAVCTLATASIVFAQGNPHGLPPGQTKRAPKVPNTSGLVASVDPAVDVSAAPSTRVRSFGAWLDDASTLQPGEAWLSLSMSKWSMPIATGADIPAVDLSVGVARAVQMSMTLPYFKVSDREGNRLDGFGDMYLASKIVLRDAATKSFGVSIGPTLEYLSRTSTTGTGLSRVNWILPLNLERRLVAGRLYGSTGYFTRGVFFASGAFEWPLNDKLVASAALSHSYVTDDEAMSEAIGLSRRRMDAGGTMAYSVSPALAVFGSVGRTMWKRDEDSTDVVVTGGVSVNMSGATGPRK